MGRSKLITNTQAAEMLGMTRGSLNNRRQRGDGPPYIKMGRHVCYREADVLEWIENRRVDPEAWAAE